MKKQKEVAVEVKIVVRPAPSVLDPEWKYTPASSTNVLQRFKAMGWVPPSEKKNAAAT
jgi:hypothetical protein